MTAPGDVLRLEDITKVYPTGTKALRGVSLTLRRGSVHGLVGANGAGKSTLIKVLAGVHPPTSGRILIGGREHAWSRPADAASAGIATIHQHVPLAGSLSVVENVFLGHRPRGRRSKAERARFAELVDRVGCPLDPDAIVGRLPIGARQMVAIFQALATGAGVVVMDEPTASLAVAERDVVFATIRRLRAEGTSFIYVSHFLDEILDLTDEVTVLRDGTTVEHRPTDELSAAELVTAIVGREIEQLSHEARDASAPAARPAALRVRGLSTPSGLHDVDLDVRVGEIVGIAGLLGSGRSELLHAIFGADRRDDGTVHVGDQRVGGSISAAISCGLGLVPEDRATQGLMLDASIVRNVAMPFGPTLRADAVRSSTALERSRATHAVDELGIVTSGIDAPVRSLSGGNAQKVLFARWLLNGCSVLLLDEPTAGVDIGAKTQLARRVRAHADAGGAALVVISEFEELLAVTDRVYIIRSGRIIAERSSAATTDHDLLALASGLAPADNERDRRTHSEVLA